MVRGKKTSTFLFNGIELIQAFDSDDSGDILPTEKGVYCATYQIPARFLKEGQYSLRITTGLPTELFEDLTGFTFEVVNHKISTLKKSFRSDRAGLLVSPGTWQRLRRYDE